MISDALAAKLFWEQTQEADIRIRKDEKLSQKWFSFGCKKIKKAFEQSNSILQNTSDFVSEHKFCTNWIDIEYQGWKLPAISEPHNWCGLWKTIGCVNVDLHESESTKNWGWIRYNIILRDSIDSLKLKR